MLGTKQRTATSETKRYNEQAAYQLGWMAYERGDDGCFPEADEAFDNFLEAADGEVTTVFRAYHRGYDDAMVAAIGEV